MIFNTRGRLLDYSTPHSAEVFSILKGAQQGLEYFVFHSQKLWMSRSDRR